MINQDKAPKPGQPISVGIYGCTRAGKTRFLFELLETWKQQDRLLPQSDQALAFMAQVRAEIEKHRESKPTAATTEGISVRVRRGADEPPWHFIFRDLRGELLTDEMPPDGEIARNGVVAKQVTECNAFLFFFDPTCSEKPDEIDKHHQRELKRATMFIEFVLKERQNWHLPIIFVQTHLDRWENDNTIRTKTDRWIGEVHARLVEQYDSDLRRMYPKTLTDRNRTFFGISSVSKTPEADKGLEEVVDQLNGLVADSKEYRGPKGPGGGVGRYALIAGAVVLTMLAFVIWLLSSMGGLPPPTNGGMPEQEIVTKLEKLEGILKAHPRGEQLPSVEEAKKVNHHLRWLTQRLNPDSDGMTGLSDETRKRMQFGLDSAADIVHEKAASKAMSARILAPILAAYLEDLPDLASTSPVLAAAQARYWQLQRAQVVEQIASIIKRRHEVASSPIDTLSEVVSKLRGMEQEIGRCKVFGPQPQHDLVQEIQTAATFCEDRKKAKGYPAMLRVASAAFKSVPKADLAWRSITLQSPGQDSVDYGLKPSRKSPTELSFTTKEPAYQIILGLGIPVTTTLFVHDGGEKGWKRLREFDLTTEQGPLAPLGLPLLHRLDQSKVTKSLRWEGMELELELSGFPRVPAFIWDAAAKAKEGKP